MDKFKVTVFGSAQPIPGDSLYTEALELGKYLGLKGWTVLTGGYIGTMEAVSRGAAENGAHVIGITCEDIERWRKVKANSWVMEERHFPTLQARLMELIDSCDAALALPGGVGTLTEVALIWNLLLTDSIAMKPLILIGAEWKNTIACFFSQMDSYIPDNQRRWVKFAPSPTSAVQMLQDFIGSGKV
jgi:uncharacterized protein (TIGR00730 family)